MAWPGLIVWKKVVRPFLKEINSRNNSRLGVEGRERCWAGTVQPY